MSGRAFPLRCWRDLGITGKVCFVLGVFLVLVLLTGIVLYVALTAGTTQRVAMAQVSQWAAIIFVAVVAVGLVAGALLIWLFHVSVTRNADRLVEAASRLKASELDKDLTMAGRDELGRLALTFDGISERLQARAHELGRQGELLQTIFDHIPVVVDMYDGDGRLQLANPEWERTFGWAVEESLGEPMLEKFYPDPDERAAALKAIMAAEPGWREFQQVTRCGREIDMLWADIRLSDGSVVGIGQDITERKQHEQSMYAYSELLESMVSERTQELENAQERLVRQEKLAALGQLAGGVSHELRNPLGVISNAVYLLRMMLTEGAEDALGEYLEIIEVEVARAEKIVTDLLEFGRIRAADRHATAVDSLIAMALDAYGALDDVDVQTDIPADIPPVWVDSYQIQQVLGNLILNACQAMPSGGRLFIAACRETGADGLERVHVRVRDTGCGIAAQSLPRLFEPLFTTKPRGIGLGLAISRNLVEANGGRLEIESVEGQGTTAILTLPVLLDSSHGEVWEEQVADLRNDLSCSLTC